VASMGRDFLYPTAFMGALLVAGGHRRAFN
jgi:hypothetical protein